MLLNGIFYLNIHLLQNKLHSLERPAVPLYHWSACYLVIFKLTSGDHVLDEHWIPWACGDESTQWAFVPPNPKDVTPTLSLTFNFICSVSGRKAKLSKSIKWFGLSQTRRGGTTPLDKDNEALIRERRPEAA